MHVLSCFYVVSTSGNFKHHSEIGNVGGDVFWTFGKPLKEQPDKTVNFLFGIFMKKYNANKGGQNANKN